MHRRRLLTLGLVAGLIAPSPLVLTGCGSASNIEPGIPANAELPKDFDPGGDAKPNMTGKTPKKAP